MILNSPEQEMLLRFPEKMDVQVSFFEGRKAGIYATINSLVHKGLVYNSGMQKQPRQKSGISGGRPAAKYKLSELGHRTRAVLREIQEGAPAKPHGENAEKKERVPREKFNKGERRQSHMSERRVLIGDDFLCLAAFGR